MEVFNSIESIGKICREPGKTPLHPSFYALLYSVSVAGTKLLKKGYQWSTKKTCVLQKIYLKNFLLKLNATHLEPGIK